MTVMLVLMASHDWKSHVSPHFDHCDLMNVMVPATRPWASQIMSRLCLDTSRHCPDVCRYIKICLVIVDISRHCLDRLIHLDICRHILTFARYMWRLSGHDWILSSHTEVFLDTSGYCLDPSRHCKGRPRFSRFTWKNTYFLSQGKFFEQLEAAAVGPCVSPMVGNLYMNDFETKAITSAEHLSRICNRYEDDTFMVHTARHRDEFLEHINSIDSSLQFTVEDTPWHTEQRLSVPAHSGLRRKITLG